MAPLNRLSHLFRGRARIAPAEIEAYSTAIKPLAERAGALYARWRHDLEIDTHEDELANSASIQRWEAAGLLDHLRSIQPPKPLARTHAELQSVITDTARAAQLLSNGYRFHSSNARCDGQALMLASEERFTAICRAFEQSGVALGEAGRQAHPDAVT